MDVVERLSGVRLDGGASDGHELPFCIAGFSRELKSKTALATGPGPD
jgi:hypothetical protein